MMNRVTRICMASLAALFFIAACAGIGYCADYANEDAFRTSPKATWIVPDWWDAAQDTSWFASTADLRAAIAGGLLPSFNQDFATYAHKTAITVADGDDRSWAGWKPAYPNFNWYGLSDLFPPGTTLHVFALGDAFVSRVCGNYSEELPEWGSITARKFADDDMNGAPNEGDWLSGWPIVLTGTASNGEPVGPFYASTACKFDGLPPGDYHVAEDVTWEPHRLVPERKVTMWNGGRWMATTPVAFDVHLSYDTSMDVELAFGNVQLGTVVGEKWDDTTVNGTPDLHENPVEYWPLKLTGEWADGTVPPAEEVETGPDGTHTFVDVPPGTYELWEDVADKFIGTEDPSYPCPIIELLGARWRGTWPLDDPEADCPAATWHYDIVLGPGDDWAEDKFGNVRLGKIIKYVLHYWWSEPIPGVSIELEDRDEQHRVICPCPPLFPQTTDPEGKVEFADLLPSVRDCYSLIVYVPDGWLPQPDPGNPDNTIRHDICLQEGTTWPYDYDVDGNNYIYDNPRREPRTLGFWINWRHRYSDEEMEALMVRVKTGSEDFADLDLGNIDDYLDPSGRKARQEMATIQYLALWLNLASERLGFLPEVDVSRVPDWDEIIDDDDGVMTIHQLMLQMRDLFNAATMTEKQWEIFKNISDAINNYEIFVEPPTGPID